MPKVTRRSQPRVSSNTPPTTTSIASTQNRALSNAEHDNISIECDKFIVVYEHHQDVNGSRHTRLHISKRGELGPPEGETSYRNLDFTPATEIIKRQRDYMMNNHQSKA